MPIKESVTVDEVIAILNRAIDEDIIAMTALFGVRVKCNEDLSNDPTIPVRSHEDDSVTVGVMGIINGLFGYDDKTGDGVIMGTGKEGALDRFIRVDHSKRQDLTRSEP